MQLWTISNMHWFLKQQLLVETPVVSLQWDAERASRLYIARKDGTVAVYDLSYEYSVCAGDHTKATPTTAAIIDGGM